MNSNTYRLVRKAFFALTAWSFCAYFVVPAAHAQFPKPQKVAIEIEASISNALAIPVDRDGIVVLQREKEKNENGDRIAHFALYNTELSQEWEIDVPIGKRLEINQYKFTDGKLYLVFSDVSEENLQLIRIDPKAGEYITMPFYAFRGISYYDMEVINDRIYLVGAFLRQSLLFMLDMNNRGNRLLNTQLGREESVIKNLTARKETDLVHVVLSNTSLDNESVAIRSFDNKGMVKDDLVVNVDKKYQLLEAELVEVGEGSTAVVGTYASKKSTVAEGVFVKKKSLDEVAYYAFQDMPDFAPTENNGKKSKKHDGDFIAINKVISLNGQFMMVTEAYDLVYDKGHNLSEQYNDPQRSFKNVWAHNDLSYHRINMTEFTRRLTAVAGYQLKYASMITFDEEGNLLWGKNLGLRDEDVSKSYKRLKVITEPGQLTFLNNYSGEVYQMEVDKKEVTELAKQNNQQFDKDGNPIPAEETTFVSGELLGAAHWYDNYYLNIIVRQVDDQSNPRKKGTVMLLSKVKS